MVANHTVEFGLSIVPAGDFQNVTLMKDYIVAISNKPLETETVNLESTKHVFFVCQAALESILPVLEERRIKKNLHVKVVSPQTVRKIAACGVGIGLQANSLLLNETNYFYKYPVEPLIQTDLILIANDFSDLSPAARTFIEMMKQEE